MTVIVAADLCASSTTPRNGAQQGSKESLGTSRTTAANKDRYSTRRPSEALDRSAAPKRNSRHRMCTAGTVLSSAGTLRELGGKERHGSTTNVE